MNITLKRPVGRPRTSNSWNRSNRYMSQFDKDIRIHYFRFHKTFHYANFIRFLNHETMHFVLKKRIGYKTSVALDNKEGDNNWWIN